MNGRIKNPENSKLREIPFVLKCNFDEIKIAVAIEMNNPRRLPNILPSVSLERDEKEIGSNQAIQGIPNEMISLLERCRSKSLSHLHLLYGSTSLHDVLKKLSQQ